MVPDGDGNTSFQFQRHYILLVYYCLIQFRNFKVSGNALYMIQAGLVVKNHVNSSFMASFKRFSNVLKENIVR